MGKSTKFSREYWIVILISAVTTVGGIIVAGYFLFNFLGFDFLLPKSYREKSFYSQARVEHTQKAYRKFLNDFPKGTLADSAKFQILKIQCGVEAFRQGIPELNEITEHSRAGLFIGFDIEIASAEYAFRKGRSLEIEINSTNDILVDGKNFQLEDVRSFLKQRLLVSGFRIIVVVRYSTEADQELLFDVIAEIRKTRTKRLVLSVHA